MNAQRFAYELITPERAAELLAHPHPRQRRAGPQKVAAYMRTMTAGRWRDDVPQPIMLAPEGPCQHTPGNGEQCRPLLNGGHRLTSVLRSGAAVTLLVAYNVPPEVFDVIDVGATRRAQQFVTTQNGAAQAACARWLLWYGSRFEQVPSPTSLTFDVDETVDYIEANPEIAESVATGTKAAKTSRVPVGLHAAVLILAGRTGADPDRLASSPLHGWASLRVRLTGEEAVSQGKPRVPFLEVRTRRDAVDPTWSCRPSTPTFGVVKSSMFNSPGRAALGRKWPKHRPTTVAARTPKAWPALSGQGAGPDLRLHPFLKAS